VSAPVELPSTSVPVSDACTSNTVRARIPCDQEVVGSGLHSVGIRWEGTPTSTELSKIRCYRDSGVCQHARAKELKGGEMAQYFCPAYQAVRRQACKCYVHCRTSFAFRAIRSEPWPAHARRPTHDHRSGACGSNLPHGICARGVREAGLDGVPASETQLSSWS
jgi:hypothetical protein